MLHLLPGTELIGAGPVLFLILPQIQFPHYPSERAVGDSIIIFALEDFLNSDHITLAKSE